MKRSGSGRVARKIGAYDDSSADSANNSQNEAQSRPETVVRRPTFGKSKKRSSLRVSFGPNDSDANDGDESSDAAVITPKKLNLSRIALEKSAQLRARSPLVNEASRASAEEDRPNYSKDYLAELRNSTPSKPKDLKPSVEEEEEQEQQALDIAAKFGSAAPISLGPETSAIPTQAEILEKKARRKRLAQEQNTYDDDEDKPWASDDDDEFRTHRNEISLRPKEKWGETRLVREDEDIAEGFDDYVEDGKIAMGRKAEREAQRRRRVEMAELINDAEGGSADEGSDDSEEERNAAFAAAQARSGRYGQKDNDEDGARTPPRITPLPDLGDILSSLQSDIDIKQQRQQLIRRKLDELKEEKVRVAEQKQYLQQQLQETAEKFEKLRQEEGLPALPANAASSNRLIAERGLDSLGTTPMDTSASDEE
ncbi:hypothetical protein BU23DRAFT_65901 [Bimuria novae-zelandiae CBS 107.79]|uniref:Uncharacterized protein n=1 Tax=Bimuria novae-zelandiae CBS 107.79 TaxID=1447943 RepID=A0A6A5VIJ2_9PLEO|nr:hypothetical protein BU23DRAFT_65901 [Bimuria novae-zelandiae CBS 107.79]